ncbi:MAG: peptide chain release factor N(5)-glutamine methyltransferase [Pseudomonadota bacterium]|nr:peptide chain release factor N(5)-glutamine methyltransferase [Pseudomonadota bacterium]
MLNSPLQFHRISAKDALRQAVTQLQQARIESASLDARLLLQHVLGMAHEAWLGGDAPLDARQEAEFRELIGKRAGRQPVSQLTGRREFWGLCFRVTGDTLDPRPDSETLIEAALEHASHRQAALKLLDLGTGTGCLLLSLLKELPQATGIGVDISGRALDVAGENAAALGMKERAGFVQSGWGENIEGPFDIVISNPPYIPAPVIPTLAPEVSRYEPMLALDGGADGLDAYRTILPQLPRLLAKSGVALFEIGIGQQKEVKNIAERCGLAVAGVREDLGGIPRCVIITHQNPTE